MQVYQGRPENYQERLEKEIRSYDLLDALGIFYQRIDHPAADTMEACNAISQALNASICKNLFLCNRQQTMFYLLIMPENKPFKTKELSAQIGSARLSFASPDFMLQYLDITPGSVSILGLMNDTDCHVQLLIDQDVLRQEWFACHPCINTSSLKFKVDDLTNHLIPALKHDMKVVTLVGE